MFATILGGDIDLAMYCSDAHGAILLNIISFLIVLYALWGLSLIAHPDQCVVLDYCSSNVRPSSSSQHLTLSLSIPSFIPFLTAY